MAKFAVLLTYGDDGGLRQRVRPKHREYLWSLANEGKLLHAGPFADDSGALLVYECESLDEAEAMLAADPFSTEGVVVDSSIREWNRVLP
jgi:uncharacterized protein YciI